MMPKNMSIIIFIYPADSDAGVSKAVATTDAYPETNVPNMNGKLPKNF